MSISEEPPPHLTPTTPRPPPTPKRGKVWKRSRLTLSCRKWGNSVLRTAIVSKFVVKHIPPHTSQSSPNLNKYTFPRHPRSSPPPFQTTHPSISLSPQIFETQSFLFSLSFNELCSLVHYHAKHSSFFRSSLSLYLSLSLNGIWS